MTTEVRYERHLLADTGICQLVVGDRHGMLQSYRESLRQKPRHIIQKATETRIGLALQQLDKRY